MDSALDRRFWPVVRSLQEMSFFDDVNLSKQACPALHCPAPSAFHQGRSSIHSTHHRSPLRSAEQTLPRSDHTVLTQGQSGPQCEYSLWAV